MFFDVLVLGVFIAISIKSSIRGLPAFAEVSLKLLSIPSCKDEADEPPAILLNTLSFFIKSFIRLIGLSSIV